MLRRLRSFRNAARIIPRIAAFAMLAALLGGCGAGATSTTQAHVRSAPLASIFEDEHLAHTDPAGAMTTFQQLGVDIVRVFVPWNAIAPDPNAHAQPSFDASDPDAYPAGVWTIYDEIVRAAAARGLRVDLTVGGGAPLWADGPGDPRHGHAQAGAAWEPSAAAFGAFVRALGLRYSGHFTPAGANAALPRVSFWSIWNEPNYGVYLAPQAIDSNRVEVAPRYYRALLDAAWHSLAVTGHLPPTDTILIGETAPRGLTGPSFPGDFAGMVPLRFIRALYCVDGSFRPLSGEAATLRGCPATATGVASFEADNPPLFEASGFADHPYQDAEAPDDTSADFPGYANFSEFGNLERTLDGAAAAYGSHAQLPIYATEFGSNTSLMTPALGAVYMNEAEYLSWRDPRIRSYDQYLLADSALGGGFNTGLINPNGTPKPGLAAYRMPMWLPVQSAAKGTPLTVWGCVRPAPHAARASRRAQHVQIEFARAGTAAFRTLLTVTLDPRSCYFDVTVTPPASGDIRLSWQEPSGPRFFSRLQAISLH
jgi:hypothetical protein